MFSQKWSAPSYSQTTNQRPSDRHFGQRYRPILRLDIPDTAFSRKPRPIKPHPPPPRPYPQPRTAQFLKCCPSHDIHYHPAAPVAIARILQPEQIEVASKTSFDMRHPRKQSIQTPKANVWPPYPLTPIMPSSKPMTAVSASSMDGGVQLPRSSNPMRDETLHDAPYPLIASLAEEAELDEKQYTLFDEGPDDTHGRLREKMNGSVDGPAIEPMGICEWDEEDGAGYEGDDEDDSNCRDDTVAVEYYVAKE